MMDVRELQQARRAAADRYWLVGDALARESGVLEVWRTPGNALRGRAFVADKVIIAPDPTTRNRLYMFAHECGHIALNHRGSKPSHRQEFEAERWAHEALRRHGVAVPRKMTARARKYVAWKIRQAIRSGCKRIDPESATFARC